MCAEQLMPFMEIVGFPGKVLHSGYKLKVCFQNALVWHGRSVSQV